MPRSHRSLVATVASVIMFAALAGGLAGQEAEPGRGYPSTDWPFTGGDWSSSRYSTLDEIATPTRSTASAPRGWRRFPAARRRARPRWCRTAPST